MNKRILALALAGALSLSLLSACGGGGPDFAKGRKEPWGAAKCRAPRLFLT